MKLLTVLFFTMLLTACSNAKKGPTFDGVTLGSCPDSPNCISSLDEREEHYYEELTYSTDRATASAVILDAAKVGNYEVITSSEEYVHILYKTKVFRFKDDLEFFLPADKKVIHMRSAARLGHSDFGVNRKRLDVIKGNFYKNMQ